MAAPQVARADPPPARAPAAPATEAPAQPTIGGAPVSAARGVAANPAALDPWHRVLSLDAQAGVGTPLGFGGVAVDATPSPYFTIGVGVGGSKSGAQGALMGRLRILSESGTGIAFGGGVSFGAYDASPLFEWDTSTRWHWSQAVWANIEMSVEHRWPSGFELRGFWGTALLTNKTASSCSEVDLEAHESLSCSGGGADGMFITEVPYMGLSLGYAFDLKPSRANGATASLTPATRR